MGKKLEQRNKAVNMLFITVYWANLQQILPGI